MRRRQEEEERARRPPTPPPTEEFIQSETESHMHDSAARWAKRVLVCTLNRYCWFFCFCCHNFHIFSLALKHRTSLDQTTLNQSVSVNGVHSDNDTSQVSHNFSSSIGFVMMVTRFSMFLPQAVHFFYVVLPHPILWFGFPRIFFILSSPFFSKLKLLINTKNCINVTVS